MQMIPGLTTRKKLDKQVMLPILVIIIVIFVFNVISAIAFLNSSVNKHVKDTLDWIATVSGLATNINASTNKSLENELNDQLSSKSSKLVEDLVREGNALNNEKLTNMVNNYSLNGAYVIRSVDQKPSIVHAVNRTIWNELVVIDPRINSVGFYQSVLNRDLTKLQGSFVDNVWVSPYTLMPNGEYLKLTVEYIVLRNEFVLTVDAGIVTAQAVNLVNSNKMIESILGSSPSIEEAAVIDIHDYLNRKMFFETDNNKIHPTIYGKYTYADKTDEDYLIALLKYNKSITVPFNKNGDEWTKAFLPINNDQAAIVVFNADSKQALSKIVTWLSIILNLLAIVAIGFSVFIVVQKRLKPIKKLESHLKKVAAGDFSGTVQINEKNELDSLGEIINDMTSSMAKMIEKLNQTAAEDVRSTEQVFIENMESLMISMDSSRHDMRNHVNVLHGLIQSKHFQEAQDYMEEIYKDLKEIDLTIKTKNPYVGQLIRSKVKVAESRKIDFDAEIDYETFEEVKKIDLSRLISNLIDNAFDAVQLRGSDRKVFFSLRKKYDSYIEIIVTNNGPEIEEGVKAKLFERGFSTKPIDVTNTNGDNSSTSERGFGLAIVQDIVKQYNGEHKVESNEQATSFFIMLDVRKST